MFSSPDSEYVAWRAERRLLAQRCARGATAINDRGVPPPAARDRLRRIASRAAQGLAAPAATLRRVIGTALATGDRTGLGAAGAIAGRARDRDARLTVGRRRAGGR